MEDFELLRPLSVRPRFTVFEAYAKKLGFQVVLKQCAFTTIAEAEFFVRSALTKARDRVYSQPLLFIFASAEGTQQSFINFVWERGEVLDAEVESDRESQFPPGKNGLEKRKTAFTDPGMSVKRVRCLTLGKDVACRVFKGGQVLDMNNAFKEALVQARRSHSNICDFLDFRMYQGKNNSHCAYIVMEWLEQDLASELRERVSGHKPYDEMELMSVLKDVTAGLLQAKTQGLTHSDIKLSNILRGPQGLKLADFGAACLKGQRSKTFTTEGSEQCMSFEVLEAVGNSKVQQRPFEADVYALGMTMLHLAATELPKRTPAMSRSKQQTLLQRKVQALKYSEELKRLLTAMLSTAPSDRPSLETVQVDAQRIYRRATQAQDVHRLKLQVSSDIAEGKYAEAIELAATVHACSRLLEDKDTASNLNKWGFALMSMGKSAEAVDKYAAAHAIYSRLPEDKHTAINLSNWGCALGNMGRSTVAVEMFTAAHAIYSRLPEDKDTAIFMNNWGLALRTMGMGAKAVKKFKAAHAIYSRLPEDKSTAFNLADWGLALRTMGRSAKAVKKFTAAHVIFSRLSEDKHTAKNLKRWGNELRSIGRSAEATEKHAAAHAIYCRLLDDKHTARNLRSWGDALESMGRNAEAVEKYSAARAIYSRLPRNADIARNLRECEKELRSMGKKENAAGEYAIADAIYSRLPDDEHTPSNLADWGRALGDMGRGAEAVEKYELARAIYVLCQFDNSVRKCDTAIAKLR